MCKYYLIEDDGFFAIKRVRKYLLFFHRIDFFDFNNPRLWWNKNDVYFYNDCWIKDKEKALRIFRRLKL